MASKEYTASYSGGSGRIDLVLSISTKETDIQKNQTIERAKVYMNVKDARSGWHNLTGSSSVLIDINGNEKTFVANFDARTTGEKVLIDEFDTTIDHNENGEAKEISVKATHITGVGLGSATIDKTYDCDTIPRYATCKQSLRSKTETTININWSSDNVVDYIEYSKDDGKTWTAVGSANSKSGTYTITKLAPNTTYNIKTRIRRKDSQLTTDSTALKVTTYNYPYITSIRTTVLTIGTSQTVNLYNPLKRSVTVKMNKDSASGTKLYSGTTTGTSLTFTPTASTLYASIPSVQSAKCIYSVTYGNITNNYNTACTYKIKGTEKPTFTNFTYADTNTDTINLTGNNQILIKGYSNVKVTIPVSNRAIAKNSASIIKYRVTIGSVLEDIAYSTTSAVSSPIIIPNIQTIKVTAIDSRGLETTVTKTLSNSLWKTYWIPIIEEVNVYREDGVGTTAYFEISGRYWNDTFGTTANTIRNCMFLYRPKDGEWGSACAILNSLTISNGRFTAKANSFLPATHNGTTPAVFTQGTQYDIQFQVVDYGDTAIAEAILNSGIVASDTVQHSDGTYSSAVNKIVEDSTTFDVNGNIRAYVKESPNDVFVRAKRDDTGADITLNTSKTGYQGVYSRNLGKWLVRLDPSGNLQLGIGIKEFTVANYLDNDWETNGLNSMFVTGEGIKHLQISVRRGTSTRVCTLPTELRPRTSMLVAATNGSGGGAAYVQILPGGDVNVAPGIFTSSTSSLMFNVTYL